MISINISFIHGQHPAEIATAIVNGIIYTERSRSCCIAKLARTLVAAGVQDQPWQTVSPNGTVSLRGPYIHAIAKTTITEGDKDGLRRKTWHPRPPGESVDGAEAFAGGEVLGGTAKPL